MSYPPTPPVRIFIEGRELIGWTTMSLERSKKEMTGNLSVAIFFTYVPKTPQMTNAVQGKEITVYIGGHLAFTGTLDSRKGRGSRSERNQFRGGKGRATSIGSGKQAGQGGLTSHIGPDQYTVTLRARGKTKRLIDSSHDHKKGTILGAKTRPVVEELVKNFKVRLDWRAPIIDMDKVRFRDGNTVAEEVHRVGNEYGYYSYETRDGQLRVTDQAGPETGEDLILGDNILEFEANQAEDIQNSDITIKGQRTKNSIRGRAAVNRIKKFKEKGVKDYAPLTLQHYTDASDEALDRRGRFEANNRASEARNCMVKVFHVQSRDGRPWDIGTLHYVEVPPEGIADVMECVSVTYAVDPEKNLSTMLRMAPPPNSTGGGGSSGGLSGLLSGLTGGGGGLTALVAGGVAGAAIAAAQMVRDMIARGIARKAQLGIVLEDGKYPLPWSGAEIEEIAEAAIDATQVVGTALQELQAYAPPPLTLPPHMGSGQ